MYVEDVTSWNRDVTTWSLLRRNSDGDTIRTETNASVMQEMRASLIANSSRTTVQRDASQDTRAR
eukprot:4944860-Pyramimonas_sp.AAC.1